MKNVILMLHTILLPLLLSGCSTLFTGSKSNTHVIETNGLIVELEVDYREAFSTVDQYTNYRITDVEFTSAEALMGHKAGGKVYCFYHQPNWQIIIPENTLAENKGWGIGLKDWSIKYWECKVSKPTDKLVRQYMHWQRKNMRFVNSPTKIQTTGDAFLVAAISALPTATETLNRANQEYLEISNPKLAQQKRQEQAKQRQREIARQLEQDKIRIESEKREKERSRKQSKDIQSKASSNLRSFEVGHYECTWKTYGPVESNTHRMTYFYEIFTNVIQLSYDGKTIRSSEQAPNVQSEVFGNLLRATGGRKEDLHCRPNFALYTDVRSTAETRAITLAENNYSNRLSQQKKIAETANFKADKYNNYTKYYVFETFVSM